MRRLLFPLVLLACSGCAVSTANRPADYQASQVPAPVLFPSDAGHADNAQISQALNYQLKLPSRLRIAVIQLSDNGNLPGPLWIQQGYDYSNLRANYADFFAALRKSPRVYDASFFPPMLMPPDMGMDSLRTAAARYQADLLLLYRARCDVNDKAHLFSASEVQADCLVEAVMVDVRSGLVPFSSVATQKLHAVKGQDDFNFDETVQKARTTAIDAGLMEIAGDADKFLQGVPSL